MKNTAPGTSPGAVIIYSALRLRFIRQSSALITISSKNAQCANKLLKVSSA